MKLFRRNLNMIISTLCTLLIFQNNLWAKPLEVPYVAQFNKYSCGAAALEMVYKYYQRSDISQQEIFKKHHEADPEYKSETRISTLSLISDAKSRGFEAFWRRVNYKNKSQSLAVLKSYLRDKTPVIVCLQFSKEMPRVGHFRVVIDIDERDNIYFYDPYKSGLMKWPADQFMDYWQPTGKDVTGGVYVIIRKYAGMPR